MKNPKKVLKIITLLMIMIGFTCCEKQDSLIDYPAFDPDLKSAALVLDQSTIDQINYLLSLIDEIQVLVEDGQLNKGNANALIVKIENSIKSLEKGNDNAAENQLSAFINETEDYVENGLLSSDQGGSLISSVDNYIILSEGSFTDPRDGQAYRVVLIGDQLWMAENLRATQFNDGTDIPLVENIDDWTSLSTPAYCWYSNDYETYGSVYGALYNWFTVNTGKLSPEGWHVPSDAEWTELINYIGGESEGGGKLKEVGTEHWLSPNEGATDEFGFTALPADARYLYREYYFLGVYSHWWSSTEYDQDHAWYRFIINISPMIIRNAPDKRYGISVRCIKD